MAERKRLQDILHGSDRDRLTDLWANTKQANDLKPLPAGEYELRIAEGSLATSRGGTPSYKLTLEVLSGDYTGRRLWHDIWLTPAALGMAKRDLSKLGVDRLEQLEQPLPDGLVVRAKVVLKREDDGAERNQISRFDVIRIDPPKPDPFAPLDGGGFDWRNGEQRGGPTP